MGAAKGMAFHPVPDGHGLAGSTIGLLFVHRDREIPQRGQDPDDAPFPYPSLVLGEAHVPAVAEAILDGRPVVADRFAEFPVGELIGGHAGDAVAKLKARRLGLALGHSSALHRDELPTTEQSGLLRTHLYPYQAPSLKPIGMLLTRTLGLRGEMPSGRAGVPHDPGCRPGCPRVRRVGRRRNPRPRTRPIAADCAWLRPSRGFPLAVSPHGATT